MNHYQTRICSFEATGFPVAAWFNGVSSLAAIVSNIYFFVKKLHKKKKNQQAIFVNFALFLMHLGFVYNFCYRYFVVAERPLCLFGFLVFFLSCNDFLLSMVGLSLDCCVAVFKPLQYRFLVTGLRIGIFYATGLLLLVILFLLHPMVAFA